MNKVFIGFLIFILIGIIAGLFLPKGDVCTEKGCYCGDNSAGRIECNSCSRSDMLFMTLLFNIQKTCPAIEYRICDPNSQQEYIVEQTGDCRLKYYIFSKSLN